EEHSGLSREELVVALLKLIDKRFVVLDVPPSVPPPPLELPTDPPPLDAKSRSVPDPTKTVDLPDREADDDDLAGALDPPTPPTGRRAPGPATLPAARPRAASISISPPASSGGISVTPGSTGSATPSPRSASIAPIRNGVVVRERGPSIAPVERGP